jgi:aspartate-semialdehyde dehydrogenase
MCSVTAAVMAVGAGMQFMASRRAASGAEATGRFANQIAENNAKHAQNLADDARARGKAEVDREKLKILQLLGQQRVSLAANKVLLGEGSAVDIEADTAAVGKIDELTLLANAEREAIGFETQGANFRSQGQLSLLRARIEADNARAKGFQALFSGFTSIAGNASGAGGGVNFFGTA